MDGRSVNGVAMAIWVKVKFLTNDSYFLAIMTLAAGKIGQKEYS